MAAKALQTRMKAVNAIIRKHWKEGQDRVVAAIMELHYTEDEARDLIRNNRFGGQGYASFYLTNNNANIRRMEQRVREIAALRQKDTEETEGTNARLEIAPEDNRVRVYFPGKPDSNTISELKRHGFRWTPSLGCWQAYCKPWNVETAKRFAGV